MSRGFLMHAYNNNELDYGTMALCSALLIKKNLKKNEIALVTSDDTFQWLRSTHGNRLISQAFDQIAIVEKDHNAGQRKFYDTRYSLKKEIYYNTNRIDSYALSPFDETILIDADYLVLDSSLDSMWGSIEDIAVNRSIRDLCHNINPAGFDKRFNEMSIPLYWATVIYFQKTDRVKAIFDMMQFVKDNYQYYQNLFQFSSSGYFRNDYALSIAIHLTNGQIENDGIKPLPISHLTVATEYDDMIGFKDGKAFFISEIVQGNFIPHKVSTNVHVMNKWSINRMSKDIIAYATS